MKKYVLLPADGIASCNARTRHLKIMATNCPKYTSHVYFDSYWEAWGLKCKIEQGLVDEYARFDLSDQRDQ